MKRLNVAQFGLMAAVMGLLASGCTHPSTTTSTYQVGPVAGRAVGTSVGVVAGNVAAFGVGTAEGLVQGAAAPFDTTTHLVRHWKTETTSDGRTIQVPVDVLVDANGRPVKTQSNAQITPVQRK